MLNKNSLYSINLSLKKKIQKNLTTMLSESPTSILEPVRGLDPGVTAKSTCARLGHIYRAASSVGVMYRSHGPNTGSNPGGGQIPKKKCFIVSFYITYKK